MARLAWRTLPYAFARAGRSLAGAVAVELRSPGGQIWEFRDGADPLTTVRGDAEEFCLVAGRRLDARDSTLVADGPDAEAVLTLLRTYA